MLKLLFCIVFAIHRCYSFRMTDEQLIHEKLKDSLRNPPISVMKNENIDISMKFRLNQIIDIDEKQQILTTSVFIEQSWSHPELSWSQTNFSTLPENERGGGTVESVRLVNSAVWMPDTYVYNYADDAESGFLSGHYVMVRRSGTVYFPLRRKLKTFCPMDICMFPFDRQECHINLGSWIHQKINYSFPQTDLESYTDNSDWVLRSARMYSVPHRFQGHQNDGSHDNRELGDRQMIRISLLLERRSFFYVWILIVPFIMLTLLSLLTFCMPATSNEKLSISLSIFMAFSMFMIMISERIPPATNQVPIIAIYLSTIMTMAATSICITVFIINIYQRQGFEQPPTWLRQLFIHRLAVVFRIRYTKLGRSSNSTRAISRERSLMRLSVFSERFDLMTVLHKTLTLGVSLLRLSPDIVPPYAGRHGNAVLQEQHPSSRRRVQPRGSFSMPPSPSSNQLKQQQPQVDNPIQKIRVAKTSWRTNKLHWEIIATVLDYLLFYIFVGLYLLIYLVIFVTPLVIRWLSRPD